MEIRRAQMRDIPRLKDLLLQVELVHHKARPDLFKNGGRKYTDEQLAEILADETRPILVAVDAADTTQGYAFCILQQHVGDTVMTAVKSLYIDDLCVEQTIRGGHIGQTLYEAAVALARSLGCYNVTLNVWAGNDSAQRFYEKCGLKPQKIGMEFIL